MVRQIKDIRQIVNTMDGRLRRMPYPVGDPAGPPVPTPARTRPRSSSSDSDRSGWAPRRTRTRHESGPSGQSGQ